MVYIRGHKTDYDDWAAAGNNGWGYNEVLPYFKNSEHNIRGDGGNLQEHLDLKLNWSINQPIALNKSGNFPWNILVGLN